MDKLKGTSLLLIIMLTSLLSGCNANKEPKMSEKQVATSFFNAIYNEKDIDKAIALSSADFKKEIEKYHTASNVARRLFNMSFDSVSLHTSAKKKQILDNYNIQVTMMIQFTGKRDGNSYKDYKKILLIKNKDQWLVDKLVED
ncbi:hypothetical protein Q4530_00910 [Colwellia sp. 1_MG-2023]|jgi:hypothetical protein|uniref:hypothetical protein n=2 Tax=Colwellia TaxID=28228 RepID=UPI001C0A2B20|nr:MULTISPECIES: hypothetical protein [unclassified Colwellia]MBU2924864.1 hypothetical protein [Colwellia sp. C2M11]MDO6487128.1 hypothetical protein [Colwellia sp. 6_MG-2023]MDO6505507.1 hypothetical protein [Colwellia sp. 5_MG-2023]MDO6650928.1 hypothetical protein [Colwellia sp. 3_MG-2023]MDO6663963.1 hypothetical protein [Colwellia sp. 2_MG-2023]